MTVKKCDCGEFKNRGFTVDAIILHDNKVLLVKRKYDPGKGLWALPGGHVDWDETAEEALARELKEETDLTLETAHLIGLYSEPGRSAGQKITGAYVVTAAGIPVPGDDAEEVQVFPIDKLPELAFDHKEIITAALQARR